MEIVKECMNIFMKNHYKILKETIKNVFITKIYF